ncbi:hypothetical protein A6B39_10970 [Mannheimia granulomatis]|uniref:hypothetical protein n=1 Tax=Mannheimia granulomatis TaxID=85402 RepID=UPI003AB98673|nr:hypothetical protein A6B39_10970 [Mannheimia granulomatis]
MFADDVRAEFDISDDYELLLGISFGYPDWDAMQNKHHLGRVPVEESATLYWYFCRMGLHQHAFYLASTY